MSDEKQNKEEAETTRQKEVQFYAASVTAWINTKFEHDRTLLTLSAGGIGLVITLITALGVSSIEALLLAFTALGGFIVCLGSVILILKRNARHIELVLKTKGTPEDPSLASLDNVAILAFGLGVLCTSIIALSSATSSYLHKADNMTHEYKHIFKTSEASTSMQGLSKMQPVEVKKSLDGISNLRPETPHKPTPQTPASNSGQTDAPPASGSQQGSEKK